MIKVYATPHLSPRTPLSSPLFHFVSLCLFALLFYLSYPHFLIHFGKWHGGMYQGAGEALDTQRSWKKYLG